MALDPNVLNYFLVVLGGFGVVWSFRFFKGRRKERIGEFEYAAFSALWGIPVFMFFLTTMNRSPEYAQVISNVSSVPMLATPALFILGVFFGSLAAGLINFGSFILRYREKIFMFCKELLIKARKTLPKIPEE